MGQGTETTRVVPLMILLLALLAGAGCGGHATARPTEGTLTSIAPTKSRSPTTEGRTVSATAEPAATGTQGTAGATPGALGWLPPKESLTPGATPWTLPYCVTVSAPATAHSGDTVTLDFHYTCLLDADVCARTNVPFRVDWLPGRASLVSPSSGMTPRPALTPTVSGIVAHGTEGHAEMTFKLAQDFTGNFGVTIYMTGSGLNYRWPDGCPTQEPGTQVTR